MRFAAIGSDGTRTVVWGLGSTADEARRDARRWLAECATTYTDDDLEIVQVDSERARAIADAALEIVVRAALALRSYP